MINIAHEVLVSIISLFQKGKNKVLDGGSELIIRKPFALFDVLQNLFQERIMIESLIHRIFDRRAKTFEHLSTQCVQLLEIGILGWIKLVNGFSTWKCHLLKVGSDFHGRALRGHA